MLDFKLLSSVTFLCRKYFVLKSEPLDFYRRQYNSAFEITVRAEPKFMGELDRFIVLCGMIKLYV